MKRETKILMWSIAIAVALWGFAYFASRIIVAHYA